MAGGAVDVVWKPYMIDPGTNPSGEEFEAYNVRRWGGSGWTRRLKSEGRKDGASFADWRWWPNTQKAHQLVSYASERGGIDTSVSNAALFDAIYERGENVSLVDTLVRVGIERLGLSDEGDLRRFLEKDEGADEMKKEIQTGQQRYGISGVPFFIIGAEGREEPPYGFSGAQGTRTFLTHFREVAGVEN